MSWGLHDLTLDVIISAVSVLVGVLALVAAYIFYKRSKTIRQLTCTLRDPVGIKFDLDLIKGKAKENLNILFGDKKVDKLSVFLADFRNTGTAPILEEHIEKRFTFTFPDNIDVIDKDTIDKSPGVEVLRQEKGSTTEWYFRSLTSNEHFTIQFLLDGVLGSLPGVDYRLPDVRVRVDKPVQSPLLTRRSAIATFVSTVVAATTAAGLVVGAAVYVRSVRIWPFGSLLTEVTEVVRHEGIFLQASSRVLQRSQSLWEYTYVLTNNGTMPVKEVTWNEARIRVMAIPPGDTVASAFTASTPPKNVDSIIRYGSGQTNTVIATVPSRTEQ
jgi:hypothetical protein